MISNYSIVLLVLVVVAWGSESPYQGKIALKPIQESSPREAVYFRPLTEEPKIANLKDNQIQLTLIQEEDSCGPLPFVDDQTPTFVLLDLSRIQKLSCGMFRKINVIKTSGFKGFIIVTDSQEFMKNHCRMYDDNHFFIGVMDSGNFSIILDYNVRGVAQNPSFVVKGSLTIELFDSADKLVEVWVNSFNSQSYEALEDLRYSFEQLPSLQGSIQWTPRFATVDCTHGDTEQACQASEYVASCGCKGEFCSPEIRGKTPAPMVQEDIRQLLIYREYPTQYLQYAALFASECLETYQRQKYVDECATRIMDRLSIDSFSINQVAETFLETCVDEQQARESEIHQILERDQRAFALYRRYPLVMINKETISYKSKDDFKSALCTKLKLEDENCFAVTECKVETESTSVVFFVLLFVCLLAIGGGVVYFYRRRLKKDMNKEIKMQVSTAVEHYFALTDTTTAK